MTESNPEISEGDAWAYTPEHLRKVEQVEEDVRAGRVVRMTEHELEQWIAEHADDGIAGSPVCLSSQG